MRVLLVEWERVLTSCSDQLAPESTTPKTFTLCLRNGRSLCQQLSQTPRRNTSPAINRRTTRGSAVPDTKDVEQNQWCARSCEAHEYERDARDNQAAVASPTKCVGSSLFLL